jgi:hypothetical protein
MMPARQALSTLLLVAALSLPVACQKPQPRSTPAVASPAGVEELRALAAGRLKAGDHAGAAQALEDAVRLAPADVTLRYLLAVALTHLDRREDAIGTFWWIIAHGHPGSEEVAFARQWLTAAGQLPPPETVASTAETGEVAGTLGGKLEWPNLDPELGVPTVQMLLTGEDSRVEGKRYGTRATLNQQYRFEGVPPGRYRLMAQAGMTRLWDLSVTIDDGKPTVLDLTQASSIAPPDALRPTF